MILGEEIERTYVQWYSGQKQYRIHDGEYRGSPGLLVDIIFDTPEIALEILRNVFPYYSVGGFALLTRNCYGIMRYNIRSFGYYTMYKSKYVEIWPQTKSLQVGRISWMLSSMLTIL